MTTSIRSYSQHIYYTFHPLSRDLDSCDKKKYAITLLVVSLLTGFIVPVFFYIGFYLYQAAKSCTPHQDSLFSQNIDSSRESIEDSENEETSTNSKTDYSIEDYQEEISKIQQLDQSFNNKKWQKYGRNIGEKFECFHGHAEKFIENEEREESPKILYVQLIGNFKEADNKIILIAKRYLEVFHHIRVEVLEEKISTKQIRDAVIEEIVNFEDGEEKEKARPIVEVNIKNQFPRIKEGRHQYCADLILDHLDSMKGNLPERNSYLIGFTSEDLYARSLTEFVFGLGGYGGCGVWSKARFGLNPVKIAVRLMKIATHEFGHMREIPHCTKYRCNIGGYMSLKELDERPLYYCAEDTAKICLRSKISILQHCQEVRDFFLNFKEEFGIEPDFSEEIDLFEKRIRLLSQSDSLISTKQ